MNIGVDIGGRHIGIGLVSEDGNIVDKKIYELNSKNKTPEYIFRKVRDYAEKNIDKVDSIGIGIPGVCLDTTIKYTCNLPFESVDVKEYLKINKPIYLCNDAVCATIAEYHFIDKKKYANYALVTLGTGIGAGIIIDGKLYIGSNGAAGEVGHMVIDKGGLECSCGRRGCFEKYASVSALLKSTGVKTLKELFYLIERNPKLANVFDEYLEDLSEGLVNIVNMYDIEMLVIGGSIAWFGDKFIHILKSKVFSKLYNKNSFNLEIKCAKLGNDAGIIGASIIKEYI